MSEAQRRPTFWTLLLLAALTGFPSMSVDLYLPSVPTIARTFDRPPSEAALTVVVFLLGLGIGQLVHGPLSDRYGRRVPLLAGIAIYTLASLGCAAAPSLRMLILARFLQALGGCAGVVVARAVVRDRWAGAEVARIFSLLLLVMGAAPLLAPLAGAALLLVVGWRAIFGVLTGFGLIMFAAVLMGLPESRPAHVADHARSETPVRAYLTLLRERELVAYVLAAGFGQAMLHTYISVSPDLFISTYRVPAAHYGWLFGFNVIGMIGGAQLNHRLLRRHSPRHVLIRANRLGMLAALLLAGFALGGIGGLPAIVIALFLAISTLGFTQPNALACAMEVDPRRSGSTAALAGAAQFGAGSLSGAVASLFYDGSGRSMAVVILVDAVIVWLALRFARAARS